MRRKREGFTLIELLVAIAIIGVLAAIALPVLSKARERGRETTCIANLRQLGQALAMYRQDHGSYPPAAPAGRGLNAYNELMVYVKDKRVFLCPSMVQPPNIEVVISYRYLADGDKTKDGGKPLGPRSVLMACTEHRKIAGYDRDKSGDPIWGGFYHVVRADGSVQRLPAGAVRVEWVRMSTGNANTIWRHEVLIFPE